MEKSILRSVIVGLEPNQEISINFRGALAGRSGEYRVIGTRRGRGKGGSQLADLEPIDVPVGTELTIGTPNNDDILNMTVKGEFFGYTQESEVPANYETDAGNAVVLKEKFKTLMDAAETRPSVSIVAPTAPEINGNFLVLDARQLRGRGGQIVLSLTPVGQKFAQTEVWSYRHSGVIESFSITTD